MATDAVEIRLKFLKEAARTLAAPSAVVSANIGSAYDSLLAAEERDVGMSQKEWDALRRDICGSCGNMMVPGWPCGTTTRIRSTKMNRTMSETSETNKPEKQLVYNCLRCDRRTVQTLQSRPSKHVKPATKTRPDELSQAVSSNALATDDSKVTKSVNATSKQRKKARKGGLQAMLDRSKMANSAQGSQLDLMDFLQ